MRETKVLGTTHDMLLCFRHLSIEHEYVQFDLFKSCQRCAFTWLVHSKKPLKPYMKKQPVMLSLLHRTGFDFNT